MPANVITILSECPLFAGIPEAAFAHLVAMARLCRYAKGQMIFREGDDCPGVYVVGSGLVRVFKSAPGGKEHVLHMVSPGGTFAEVAAIGRFELPASAEAVADSVLVLLPQDRFARALQEDHDLCLGLLTSLTVWVRRLVGLMGDVVLRDAAGRIARYLLDCPADGEGRIELPTLKRHLASHLNLTSETFSRTLRRLGDAGLVEEDAAGRVRLLDRESLGKVAEGLFPRM